MKEQIVEFVESVVGDWEAQLLSKRRRKNAEKSDQWMAIGHCVCKSTNVG